MEISHAPLNERPHSEREYQRSVELAAASGQLPELAMRQSGKK
jgi:hypothetical protein